jgi:hypothetical protein
MGKGLNITDLRKDEIEIIRERVDFELPEDAKIISAFCNSNLVNQKFSMIFYIPEQSRDGFILSLSGFYYHIYSVPTMSNIEIGNKKYLAKSGYDSIQRDWTELLEYEVIDNKCWFKWVCTDSPQQIDEIFYSRLRILPAK